MNKKVHICFRWSCVLLMLALLKASPAIGEGCTVEKVSGNSVTVNVDAPITLITYVQEYDWAFDRNGNRRDSIGGTITWKKYQLPSSGSHKVEYDLGKAKDDTLYALTISLPQSRSKLTYKCKIKNGEFTDVVEIKPKGQ